MTAIYNPFSLEGKTVLVTGASSGIGRAIAIECSKMGAAVVISARSEERLHETLALMDNGNVHKVILADLADGNAPAHIAEQIDSPLNGIVQCAGLTVLRPFQLLSKESLRYIMTVNFEAPVLLTHLLLKKKKTANHSSIVFISSISGILCSSVAGSLYSASKGAVNGIIKGMALDLAPKNIRVNSINPGMIDTHIFDAGTITGEQLEEDRKRYPLKRYGKPEEVAYAAIYLLSDASCWVTGSNLVIDGGYTLL
jgi:NAD(P)-dependent dehydrogenase (short-subunit alcohol dehydrogenase family)